MFMTKKHTLPFSKAFFDCNKTLGTKALFALIQQDMQFYKEAPQEPFDFWSLEIINAHKACIVIKLRILSTNEMLTAEIHLKHGPKILKILHQKLSDEYQKDRDRHELREYYVKNLSDNLGI